MPNHHFHFMHPKDGRTPYIQELYEFNRSGDSYIHFDGYYYVDDSELPQQLLCFYQSTDDEPYKIEDLSGGGQRYHYKNVEDHVYVLEFTRREIIECTDQISEEIDDDGTPMNICFFPTNNQKLYCTILAELCSAEGIEEWLQANK